MSQCEDAKSLPEAVADYSRARGGPAVLVIEIRQSEIETEFAAEQASCSGELAKKFSAPAVLSALIAILHATLTYYQGLLSQAEAEARTGDDDDSRG